MGLFFKLFLVSVAITSSALAQETRQTTTVEIRGAVAKSLMNQLDDAGVILRGNNGMWYVTVTDLECGIGVDRVRQNIAECHLHDGPREYRVSVQETAKVQRLMAIFRSTDLRIRRGVFITSIRIESLHCEVVYDNRNNPQAYQCSAEQTVH